MFSFTTAAPLSLEREWITGVCLHNHIESGMEQQGEKLCWKRLLLTAYNYDDNINAMLEKGNFLFALFFHRNALKCEGEEIFYSWP
jgi:hypothetical protein